MHTFVSNPRVNRGSLRKVSGRSRRNRSKARGRGSRRRGVQKRRYGGLRRSVRRRRQLGGVELRDLSVGKIVKVKNYGSLKLYSKAKVKELEPLRWNGQKNTDFVKIEYIEKPSNVGLDAWNAGIYKEKEFVVNKIMLL